MSTKVIDLFGNSNEENGNVKYSELFEQFINPFAKALKGLGYAADIFEFSMNAWNMANINQFMQEDGTEEDIASLGLDKKEIRLLEKMIAHKQEKFSQYTNFIISYDLKEGKPGKAHILSVVTEESDHYIANMLETINEDDYLRSEDDFEENFINRHAIIMTPLQPLVDWISDLNPDTPTNEINHTFIYLVSDEFEDLESFLKKKYDTFFTAALNDWHSNKKEWPQKRNYKMLKQWFDVRVSDSIFDMVKEPVLKSEY